MNLERLQHAVLLTRHYWAAASLLARAVRWHWQRGRALNLSADGAADVPAGAAAGSGSSGAASASVAVCGSASGGVAGMADQPLEEWRMEELTHG